MNKSLRKLFSLALALALVFSSGLGVGTLTAQAEETTNKEFTDIANLDAASKEHIEFVTEREIFKGNTDGTFRPYEELTRRHAAMVLVRALDLKVADEFLGTFTDVKDTDGGKEIEALASANIISGYKDGTFKPEAFVTRTQFAKMVTNGYELAMGDKKVTLSDIDNLGTDKKFVETVVSNDIVNGYPDGTYRPNNHVLRVHVAKFLTNTIELVEGQELVIESASAISAKTVEVKFNKAVLDKADATIELLRGTFKQNTTTKWAEDMKSVELVGANNFQAGDYVVNVKGLSEETLTAGLKIEAQKVATIEILDDVAVVDKGLVNGKFPNETSAQVAYMVKDQYGVDMTKTADLRTNDADNLSLNVNKGVVEIKAPLVQGKTVGDLVPVVLIDATTGISTTKTLKLSATATVSEISVTGIYNAKGEVVELNDKSTASKAFILVELLDQYGKEITEAEKASGLVVTNTNDNNIVIENKVVEQKIGDDKKLVVKISNIIKAGNTDILLISTTNGKSAKYTVSVAETTTADAIIVGQPEVAVVKEETLVPITVNDKSGNTITDVTLLSTLGKGIKQDNQPVDKNQLTLKDGQVYYKVTFEKEGTQALVFTTSTYKVGTITINVKAKAVPTAIRGLKNPLVVKSGESNKVTVAAKDHLIIEDQYGRVMKDNTDDVKVSVVGESDVVTLSGTNKNIIQGMKNGTATLKVQLLADTKGSSAVEVEVRVTDGKEYKSYEVKDLGLLQANKEDGNDVVVYGVLANGGKVELVAADYVATTNLTGVAVTEGKLSKVADDSAIWTVDKTSVTERDLKVTYTINNDGQQVEHTYKLSKKDPKTQDYFFTEADSGSDVTKAKEITKKEITGDLKNTTLPNILVTDQYGNKEIKAITADQVLTIVPADASKVSITGNATKDALVKLVSGVEEAEVTVKVKVGNALNEIKITLK